MSVSSLCSLWFLPRPRQHVIGTNLVSHSNLVRLLVRVLVLVDVFLCQRVDVIVGIIRDLYNLPTQRDETIRIFGILDAQCDVAVATHIFVFNSAFCAIDPHVSTIIVAPYRRDLWAAVLHNRCQMSKSLLLEEITKFVGYFRGHACLLFRVRPIGNNTL